LAAGTTTDSWVNWADDGRRLLEGLADAADDLSARANDLAHVANKPCKGVYVVTGRAIATEFLRKSANFAPGAEPVHKVGPVPRG
jgi:hypothetical protein